MNLKRALFLTAIVALSMSLVGCATDTMLKGEPRPAEGTQPPTPEIYERAIEKYSAGDTEYAGLYNNFEYKATLMNSSIRDVISLKLAYNYQWDTAKAAIEREKSNQEMASSTKVFFAFFTPDLRNDNLNDFKSIWKVYIDAGGRRYEGKVKRISMLLAELQAMYPYATRWTTPYEAIFDVPTAAIESQKSTFTITGPLGTRNVEFAPLQ